MSEYGGESFTDEASASPAEAPVAEAAPAEAAVPETTGAEALPTEASAPAALETTMAESSGGDLPGADARLAEASADAPYEVSDVTRSDVEKAVKDEVAKGGESDVLGKAATAEGLDPRAMTDAVTEHVQQEVKQRYGEGAAEASAEAVGTIRGESLDAARADIATARANAETMAAAEHNYPPDYPLAELWNNRNGDSPGEVPLETNAGERGSDMGGYEAHQNDYSALKAAETPTQQVAGETDYPPDHPLAELWNGREFGSAGTGPGSDGMVEQQYRNAAREVTAHADDVSSSAPEQFGAAAVEVTRPAESDGSVVESGEEEGDPQRPIRNSRLEYEIRPTPMGTSTVANWRK